MREKEKKSEVSEGEGEEEAGEEEGEEKNNSGLVPYESDNDATFPQKSYSVALQSYACLLSRELSRVKRDSDSRNFFISNIDDQTLRLQTILAW